MLVLKWSPIFGQRCKVEFAPMRGPYCDGETIFLPDFKARVALATMCGDSTIAELADRYLNHRK